MATKVVLTLGEKIDRAKDGRTQTWIVGKLNEQLSDTEKISEVQFSRKKTGKEDFTETEIEILSEILNTDLSV